MDARRDTVCVSEVRSTDMDMASCEYGSLGKPRIVRRCCDSFSYCILLVFLCMRVLRRSAVEEVMQRQFDANGPVE